jgi:DNA-binding transcriptional LysR family regulator
VDRLKAMETFVRVVETGSFSAVARDQGVQQSAVSKQIAALEAALNTTLLTRTTRALSLTEAGEAYFARLKPILSDLDEAQSAAASADTHLRGQLRIAASVGFGRRLLMPHLKAFRELYPDVQIDLRLNDHFIDLIERGVDVAIRIGQLENSTLKALPLTVGQRRLIASRRFLETHGSPGDVDDIDPRHCVAYTERPDPFVWSLPGAAPGLGAQTLRLAQALTTNSSEIVHDFVSRDLGYAFAPGFLFEAELASGEAVALWPERAWPLVPVYLVYPPERRQVARVRVFVDFMKGRIPSVLKP